MYCFFVTAVDHTLIGNYFSLSANNNLEEAQNAPKHAKLIGINIYDLNTCQ